uniref:lipoyl(octanoyl) transferase n=1 Tax=Kalanchoe fedtschenkoi TaxID=63787 RepID=A0A7N0TFP4_KALFE
MSSQEVQLLTLYSSASPFRKDSDSGRSRNPSIKTNQPCSRHHHFRSSRKINRISSSRHPEVTSPVPRVGNRRCVCYDLHKELVPYKSAWDWQREVVGLRKELASKDVDFEDTLMVLQHCPVYTMGTGSKQDFLKFDVSNAPYDLYRTERGGEVTYHGPGQLVMYPIMNLRYHKMDLHWYLRALEEVIMRALSSSFSIKSSRLEDFTGVWVDDQKVAAIGVRVSKWVSFHGLALNVTTDLTPFKQIVPCGIRNREVGSIKNLLAETSTTKYTDSQIIEIAHNALIKEFSGVFQLELEMIHNSMHDLLPQKSDQS